MYEKIKEKIHTKYIGRNIYYVKSTDSTNLLAKRESNLDDGTVFMADEQTQGRGRNGKIWISQNNEGLWMSILLKPDINPEKLSALTLIAGLCVVKTLREKYDADAFIKWPNDIVLSKKKLGGILCEAAFSDGLLSYAVVGIGINLFQESFDDEIENIACSLYGVYDKKVDKQMLCADILNIFEPMYEEFLKNGIDTFLAEYKNYCITLGKEIRVIKDGVEENGVAVDITNSGELIVESQQGESTVFSGEVSVRGLFDYI